MIDWLKFRVPLLHLPIRNQAKLVSMNADGSIEWEKPRRLMVSGSFDDCISVTSTGPLDQNGLCTELEIDGNVTKFFQGHNLWGVDDHLFLAESIVRWLIFDDPANVVVAANPMAPLYPSTWQCNRIDITHYADVGSRHNVNVALESIGETGHTKYQRAINTKGTVYVNKNSRRWGFKFYDKYSESGCRGKGHAIKADPHVIEALRGSVETLVRCELVLRQNEMRDRDIKTLGQLNISELFKEYLGKIKFEANNRMTTADVEKLPQKLKLTYTAWASGMDVRSLVSRTTYYQHKRELTAFDIDISKPPRGVSEPVNVVSFVRYIEAMPVSIPSNVKQYVFDRTA